MTNLDALKGEIDEYLEEQGFAIFRGFPRMLDTLPLVYWDCDRYPDYKAFLTTAKAAAVQLVVYHQEEFSVEQIENALERLEEVELPREEYRAMERRLKELRVYEGFTCALELSFDLQGRIYVYDLRTDWYDELSELMDDLHMLGAGSDDDTEDDSPMSGYFRRTDSLRWILPETDPARVRELSAALRIRALTARVLINRRIDSPDAALRFLRPSLDHLYDPFLLAGMRDAVARLKAAIANREKILIYGDYDVDGTISVVILKKAIELAGGHAEFHVPHRLKDGYGMRTEVIEEAGRRGVNLIVSVDTGIRALEVVRAARELGIDVVVTDHHLPESELPPAVAVLNPNRPGCPYPEKNLCGAGVAFKLVQALLQTLDWPAEKRNRMLRSFLKLVAIATVADVVPLTGENRVIVKHGLEGLDRVTNPGLRALLDVAGLGPGKRPTAGEVAFRVAPRINAAGRMAHAANVIHMFLTNSLEEARSFAQELHDLNQERQQTEAEMVRTVLELCVAAPVTPGDAALVFSGANWHRGVVGIVASRLVDRFCRPVFVLCEEEGQAQGSGRSISAFHLLDALESMPELFTRFGGHRQAAGLSMSSDRVPEFRSRFNAYAAARLTPEDFVPRIAIDAVLALHELDEIGIAELLSLAPFGFSNPAPLLAATGAECTVPPVILKEKHLRVQLRQNGRRLMVKAWNFAERAGEVAAGSKVDMAFCIEEDAFAASQGWPGWSATLKDVRPATRNDTAE